MSVFYRDIDVKISDYKSELSKPLIVYERDRGLEIYFNLKEYAYKYDKKPLNLLENLVGAYATVTLVNPSGVVVASSGLHIEYVVKNGWCNVVYMFNITSSTTVPWTKIAAELPKPATSNVNAILINEGGEIKRINTRIRTDKSLYLAINEPISEAGWWMGEVIYPVAEN